MGTTPAVSGAGPNGGSGQNGAPEAVPKQRRHPAHRAETGRSTASGDVEVRSVVTRPVEGAAAPESLARRERRREALAVLVVLLCALVTFGWQWNRDLPRTGSGDSYWYLRTAAQYAGTDQATAQASAGRLYCDDVQRAFERGGSKYGCTSYRVTVSPRYVAIFDSRPGFPLAAAPAVAVLGLARGALLTTAGFFLLVAGTGYGALRASGLRRVGAGVGAVLLGVLPIGYWDSRMLAEGAATAGILGAVWAAVPLLRRPTRRNVTGLAVALTWTFLTKPASGAALALLLLLVALVVPGVRRTALNLGTGPDGRRDVRRYGRLLLGGVALLTLGAWTAVSAVLHLPGLTETAQDLATGHFVKPDVAQPYAYLWRAFVAMWPHLPRFLGLPFPLVPVLVAAAVACWWLRRLAGPWLAATAAGLVVVAAHPTAGQFDRLTLTLWLVVALCAAIVTDEAIP